MLSSARGQAGSDECKIAREGKSKIERGQTRRVFDAHQMIGRLKGFYAPPRTVASRGREEKIMTRKKALRSRGGMMSSPMLRLGLMAFTVRWGDLMPCWDWEGTFQSSEWD